MTARLFLAALGCLLCLLAPIRSAPAAALRVTAEVDAREVYLGQSLVLRVLVPGDAPADVSVPELADCTVTPRGLVHGSRGEDGAVVAAYRFELTPRRVGECRVPALRVTAGGETGLTGPVAVRVLPRPTPPKGLAGRDLFVDAVLSPEAPYAGQPVRYTVLLYRAVAVEAVHVSPPGLSGAPGATLDPLPGQRDGEIEAGGRRYAVTEVDYRLTPRLPGRFAVPPATAVFRGVAATAASRGMAAPAGPARDATLAGPALAVTVRPLPAYDGPVPFTGLVGRLELAARIEDEAAPGRDAVYVLTLSGAGNLREAVAPALSPPPGVTARLLPSEGAPEDAAGGPGEGNARVFRYALAASGSGDYVLPGPKLAVFDPEAGAYRLAAAGPVSLRVGTPPPDPALAPPLRHDPRTARAAPPSWPWRLGLGLLPLALYGLTFLPRPAWRHGQDGAPPATPTAVAEALRQALDRSRARAQAGDRRPGDREEGGQALNDLDRLLYGGGPAGPAAVDAAVARATKILRRLGP
uniref:Oxygen tolerance n=1 Tax=Desulfovibrio sp. U5L TaxID=596152 RepID=I2Q5R1_9BACT